MSLVVKGVSYANVVKGVAKETHLKDSLSLEVFLIIIGYLDCCPSLYCLWWPKRYNMKVDLSLRCCMCALMKQWFVDPVVDEFFDFRPICSNRCADYMWNRPVELSNEEIEYYSALSFDDDEDSYYRHFEHGMEDFRYYG